MSNSKTALLKLAVLILALASLPAFSQIINPGGSSVFPQNVSGTTTSGGIICFTSTTVESSSAILNSNVLVKGGGAGVCPTNSLATDSGTVLNYTGTGGISVGTAPAGACGTGFCIGGTEGATVTGTAAAGDWLWMNSASHCGDWIFNNVEVGCSTVDNGTNTAGASMTLNMSAATGANALQIPSQAGLTSNGTSSIAYDTTGKLSHLPTDGADSIAIAQICKTSQKNETTTADANVLTCAPAAIAGTYRISVVVSVSAATSGIIGWTATWTDSNAAAQTPVELELFQNATAAPALTFTTSAAGNYRGSALIDVNNAGTSIVIKWIGGGTTTAKVSAMVERVI